MSPYFPSIPAVPGTPVGSGTVLERIIQAETEVVRSRDVPFGVKREAIHVLRQVDVKSPAAMAAFRSALEETDQSVRLSAAAALVAADDVSVLPLVESVLLRPMPEMSVESLQGLRAAISLELRVGPGSIAAMARLFSQGDAPTRQAVSRALRRAHSPATLQLLTTALDDPDMEVAYNAVIGVAEATGHREKAPSLPGFRAEREHYVAYWKEQLRNK